MRTLSELKKCYDDARELAKAGNPSTAKEAAAKLFEIYKYCCEYHDLSDISIAERAQALALMQRLETVIRRMLENGYRDEAVAAFLGYEFIWDRSMATPVSVKKMPDAPTDSKPSMDFSIDIGACLGNTGGGTADEPLPAPVSKAAGTAPAAPASDASGGNWGADMFERYVPATVVIATEKACGTGFFISNRGYILTNHHVVYTGNQKASTIRITAGDGKTSRKASVIAADKTSDVALLRVSDEQGSTAVIPLIEDYAEVRAGDDVMLIGNAMNAGLAPVIGTVKFPSRANVKHDMVYTAMTNGGDSGSPLIDRRGRCVAIHKAREGEGGGAASIRGIAYATNAAKIKELLHKWKKEYKLDL